LRKGDFPQDITCLKLHTKDYILETINENQLLEEYSKIFVHNKHIEALYIINLEKTKVFHKIISDFNNHNEMLPIFQKILKLLKEDNINLLYMESDYQIFLKRLTSNENMILVVIADNQGILGNIFSLLRKI